MSSALAGHRVLVTRERPGELARMLEARGAVAVHVPLIAVIEPADGGRALRRELDQLDRYDWLIVTSAAGADRVAAAAATAPTVKLAAVGTATAGALSAGSGREVDLVPTVQLATALAATFRREVAPGQRVLIAQSGRATEALADALRRGGHEVTVVVAYRTIDQEPDREAVRGADAVAFASASSVESWVSALGVTCPPIAVAIGPSTATAARRLGLKLSGIAADHSLDGLVTELERQFATSTTAGR